jgi:ABC-type antimicrobial peptide transport system permease subunit
MNLTNIDDVHFSGEKGTPIGLVYAIMGLGVFILVVACFNFVNLNIAQSFRRSRELGVRKTLGAYKRELILQLWGEAFLLYLIGFIIGAAIVFQLIPIFNSQFDAQIEFSSLLEPGFILIISGIFFVVTLIAGGLPALKMANFSLIEIIKGNVTAQKPGALRNGLIVGQFTISSLLICVSWIAGQQLNYLKELPIGFEKEQVVSIPVGEMNDGRKILSRLRNAFSQYPGILSLTGTGSNLGRGLDKTSSRTTIGTDYQQNHIEADWILTDFDYLKTLGIPLIEGRDFSPDIASDSINSVVVTESFIQEMGEPNPIGKYFGGDAVSGTRIIGVVNNFNAYSPAKKSLPIAMHISPKEHINYIFVKVRLDDHQQVMKVLEAEWAKHTDNAAFNASFLDENLQAWYEEETILTTIFGIASAIAIFLSCLGLFAISLLVIELRTKEIGIRKVMGASVSAIVRMVFIHFFKLIMISLLIALPLGWYAMHSWIENYAYRIQINPLTLFAIGLLVTVVALATVSYHSIKAAILNPVKSLRTE